jgi:hypothetical protein
MAGRPVEYEALPPLAPLPAAAAAATPLADVCDRVPSCSAADSAALQQLCALSKATGALPQTMQALQLTLAQAGAAAGGVNGGGGAVGPVRRRPAVTALHLPAPGGRPVTLRLPLDGGGGGGGAGGGPAPGLLPPGVPPVITPLQLLDSSRAGGGGGGHTTGGGPSSSSSTTSRGLSTFSADDDGAADLVAALSDKPLDHRLIIEASKAPPPVVAADFGGGSGGLGGAVGIGGGGPVLRVGNMVFDPVGRRWVPASSRATAAGGSGSTGEDELSVDDEMAEFDAIVSTGGAAGGPYQRTAAVAGAGGGGGGGFDDGTSTLRTTSARELAASSSRTMQVVTPATTAATTTTPLSEAPHRTPLRHSSRSLGAPGMSCGSDSGGGIDAAAAAAGHEGGAGGSPALPPRHRLQLQTDPELLAAVSGFSRGSPQRQYGMRGGSVWSPPVPATAAAAAGGRAGVYGFGQREIQVRAADDDEGAPPEGPLLSFSDDYRGSAQPRPALLESSAAAPPPPAVARVPRPAPAIAVSRPHMPVAAPTATSGSGGSGSSGMRTITLEDMQRLMAAPPTQAQPPQPPPQARTGLAAAAVSRPPPRVVGGDSSDSSSGDSGSAWDRASSPNSGSASSAAHGGGCESEAGAAERAAEARLLQAVARAAQLSRSRATGGGPVAAPVPQPAPAHYHIGGFASQSEGSSVGSADEDWDRGQQETARGDDAQLRLRGPPARAPLAPPPMFAPAAVPAAVPPLPVAFQLSGAAVAQLRSLQAAAAALLAPWRPAVQVLADGTAPLPLSVPAPREWLPRPVHAEEDEDDDEGAGDWADKEATTESPAGGAAPLTAHVGTAADDAHARALLLSSSPVATMPEVGDVSVDPRLLALQEEAAAAAEAAAEVRRAQWSATESPLAAAASRATSRLSVTSPLPAAAAATARMRNLPQPPSPAAAGSAASGASALQSPPLWATAQMPSPQGGMRPRSVPPLGGALQGGGGAARRASTSATFRTGNHLPHLAVGAPALPQPAIPPPYSRYVRRNAVTPTGTATTGSRRLLAGGAGGAARYRWATLHTRARATVSPATATAGAASDETVTAGVAAARAAARDRAWAAIVPNYRPTRAPDQHAAATAEGGSGGEGDGGTPSPRSEPSRTAASRRGGSRFLALISPR